MSLASQSPFPTATCADETPPTSQHVFPSDSPETAGNTPGAQDSPSSTGQRKQGSRLGSGSDTARSQQTCPKSPRVPPEEPQEWQGPPHSFHTAQLLEERSAGMAAGLAVLATSPCDARARNKNGGALLSGRTVDRRLRPPPLPRSPSGKLGTTFPSFCHHSAGYKVHNFSILVLLSLSIVIIMVGSTMMYCVVSEVVLGLALGAPAGLPGPQAASLLCLLHGRPSDAPR